MSPSPGKRASLYLKKRRVDPKNACKGEQVTKKGEKAGRNSTTRLYVKVGRGQGGDASTGKGWKGTQKRNEAA